MLSRKESNMRSVYGAFILAGFLLSPVCRAQEMILEAAPGTSTLSYCDMAHNLRTCATVHVETPVALNVGSALELDRKPYVISWMGRGYYLDNGVILEPMGALVADLKGQRWVEV